MNKQKADFKEAVQKYEYQGKLTDKVEIMDTYAGKKMLHHFEASNYIQEILTSDKPVMITRFGGNELKALVSGICDPYPYFIKNRHAKNVEQDGLFNGAGVFPRNVNLIPGFADVMIKSCAEADLLGVWFNEYEDLVIEQLMPQLKKVCFLGELEPYSDINNPWSKVLRDQKVLVVHPFAESIRMQFEKRESLFENKDMLPSMELKTLKAVQTIAGQRDRRFKNWFAALDYMHEQTRNIDYDIAILGCGAYGMPLAARIKKDGKKAIHIGGATQILFGIKGRRWDETPTISCLYNEHWVKPLEKETPLKAKTIENGCYW